MKKLKVILFPVVILGLGAILMVTFLGMREDSPRRNPEPRTRVVDSRTVTLGPVAATITAYGTVISAQPVALYSEVTGKLMPGDIPFKPAQTFDSGQVLLKVDDRQVRLDKQSAISDLLNALAGVLPDFKSQFPEAYVTWNDYFESIEFNSPVPSLPEVSDQRVKLFLSRFNVYKLYFRIRDLEIELEKHNIRAPFDGTIVATDLRVGSTARNGSLLGNIINLSDLEVQVPLPAPDVPWVNFDSVVLFTSNEFEGEWRGQIRRVGRSITLQTQSVPLYVELTNRPGGQLPEGVFFEADVPGKVIDNAFEVPRRALYDEKYVYLVRDGRLEYQAIEIARLQKETAIVNGGLANGDTLVIEPLQGVAPGMLAEARLITASGEID